VANPGRRKRNAEILSMLLEKADVQGYLTTEDLMEFYPDVSKDAEHIEAVVVALRRHGVDLYDGEAEAEFVESDPTLEPSEYSSFSNLENISSDDTIGLYLKEMSRVPLLTMEEELDIAQRIELGRNSKKELDRSNGSTPIDRKIILEGEIEDGLLARDHLIKANTRLVVSVAKRYIGRGVPFLDLIQEGNLGLMKAVEKFDYHRGFRFSTYATWSYPPMPPGGSARRSPARLLIRDAPSACRCTWWIVSASFTKQLTKWNKPWGECLPVRNWRKSWKCPPQRWNG